MKTKVNFNGKRVILFSFLLFSTIYYSQTFVRSSDEKTFNNVIVKHDGKNVEISKTNFKNFSFKPDDKIVYENRLLDFSINQDTLYFFDKVKEIEAVEIIKFNGKKKTLNSSRKRRSSAEIFANRRIASLIEIESEKKTFIKSLILLIYKYQITNDFDGILKIQILKNANGFPDDSSEQASFEINIAELMANHKPFTEQKIQLDLPNIIKYPKEGLFVVLHLETDKKHTVSLTQNEDTQMFVYYPKEGWKKQNFNGYYYQLKILQ
jgi:hypothetical protein